MATTYMGMTLPTVGPVAAGGTAGPTWATQLRAALDEKLDSHDHTTGKGKKVPIAGISFNSDIDVEEYSLIDVKRMGLKSQTASLASVGNKNSIYVKDGELYYISSSGVNVQITAGAGLNLTSLGTIGGDFSTSDATVTYSDTSKSFLFKQDSGKTADIAAGSLFIYENIAGGKYSKFQSPDALSSNLSYTLPSALPASVTLPMLSSTAGILSFGKITTSMLTANAVDNAAIRQSAGLSVLGRSANSSGDIADITAGTDDYVLRRSGTSIGFGQVATGGIADGAITQAKRAALGQQISNSSGSFSVSAPSSSDVTNLSVEITTTGRPVFIGVIGNSAINGATFAVDCNTAGGTTTLGYQFSFVRDELAICRHSAGIQAATESDVFALPANFFHIDTPSAGTYTYSIQVNDAYGDGTHSFGATSTVRFRNATLVAFEL
jgi:hypothetical protein